MQHSSRFNIFNQCNRFFTKISRLCTFSFFIYPAMKTAIMFFYRITFLPRIIIWGKTLIMFCKITYQS